MTHTDPPLQVIRWRCERCGAGGLGGATDFLSHSATCPISPGGFSGWVSDVPYKTWLANNLKTNRLSDDNIPKDRLKPIPMIEISLMWLVNLILRFIQRRLQK